MKRLLVVAMTIVTTTAFGFGWSGSDGRDGRSGSSGSDGRNYKIVADGSAKTIVTNGQDGRPGLNGMPGEDAYNCAQPRRVQRNLHGADGGDGGDGGNGGSGGDGGNVLVFYSDIQDLKQVYVESLPGYGAAGGYSAYGGRGCKCQVPTWRVRKCKDVKVCTGEGENRTCKTEKKCTVRHYRCYDGTDGRVGSDGYRGSNGVKGRLRIAKDIQAIPQQTPQATLSLDDAIYGATLSKNIWIKKSGARQLLAAGSNLKPKYLEWSHLAKKDFQVVWQAPRMASQFRGQYRLGFDGTSMSVVEPADLFMQREVVEDAASKKIVVKKVFTRSELTSSSLVSTTGRGSKLKITVNDPMLDAEGVTTSVHLRLSYKKKVAIKYTILHNKMVDPSVIVPTANGFTISASDLDMSTSKLTKKRKIQYTLTITKTFGGKSVSKELKQGPMKL
jgi:hypothetical protein